MDKVKNIIRQCEISSDPTLKLEGFGLNEVPVEVYDLVHLKTLNLRNNNIKEVSKKIFQLENLEEIFLIGNQIETLPLELSQLPNLRRVHLSNNRLKDFPTEFIGNEKISHLCLRNNLIEVLPDDIEEMKIREVQLTNNKIKKVSITYDNADFYLTLALGGNPLVAPPYKIFNGGLTTLLKYLYEKDKGRTFIIPFITELKTTFKQYLIYFGDFVKCTKGKLIGFEVKDVVEGIEIEVKTENNTEEEIEEVRSYLQEYVSFIKTKVEDIKPNFEVNIDNSSKEFVLLELRSQVRHLQTQVEIKTAINSSLIEDRDRYYQLLNNLTQTKNHFVITNQNLSENLISQTNDFQPNVTNNISNLLEGITNLRKLIPKQEGFVAKELEAIDNELLELEDCGSDTSKVNKATFKKLKRVLDEINDESSSLNKVIKGSQKALKAVQEVGKTYNKFAEWLALPQVPKVFLGGKD